MRTSPTRSHVLAVGFGTTVAMWSVLYVCRLPFVMAPSAVVLSLLLLCQLGGGLVAGRYGSGGAKAALLPSFLSAILNLLVLGSFLAGDRPNSIVPTALLWVPGSILASVALGYAGGLVGERVPVRREVPWTAVFVRVAVIATFFLLLVGGLVTSNDAGLAVADWPNSYGYNMFLYPFSRMTGGIYFEHAHRLFGSLVGLTTLVLGVHLFRVEPRRWVARVGIAAVVLVIVQGVLGGLRVTGRLTLSTETEPSLVLAVVHGVTAQLFFSILVALAVFTSPAWIADPGDRAGSRAPGRTWMRVTVASVLLQLVLGALLRHMETALYAHLAMAVVVGVLGIRAGRKAGASGNGALRRAGVFLRSATEAQIFLGIGALVTTRILHPAQPGALDVVFTTAHQGTGALVLAGAVALLLWTEKLSSAPSGATREAPLVEPCSTSS